MSTTYTADDLRTVCHLWSQPSILFAAANDPSLVAGLVDHLREMKVTPRRWGNAIISSGVTGEAYTVLTHTLFLLRGITGTA